MKYSILVYEHPAAFEDRNGPNAGAYWAAYQQYMQDMQAAGVVAAGGAALMPPHAGTSLRIQNGQRHVQDGPFADTKEQLGGYFHIDVPDLETALEWAARCPAAAAGGVEVRPHLQMNP